MQEPFEFSRVEAIVTFKNRIKELEKYESREFEFMEEAVLEWHKKTLELNRRLLAIFAS